MATQYTTLLKLALPTQGELSGSWGDVVNNNITSMIEEAVAGLKTIDTWSSNSATLSTANGLTAESRAAMLNLTDSTTDLSGAATLVCPTLSKVYIVKNSTGQTVTINTASGNGIAISNGNTSIVFCDGTNVVEAVTGITGNLDIGGNLTVGGNATVTGTTTFNGGTLTLGDSAADNVVFGADVNSSIIPNTDDTFDLGSSGQEWRNLYLDGTANIDALVADEATIDSININGKVITMTGDTDDTAIFTAGSDGTLTIATTDAAGAAANITITADGTAELAGTTVTLNSGGGITLDADGGTITFADAGSSLGTITSNGFTGNVVGNVTGNVSGTAATVTGAAQSNITSVGTLTALTIDDVGVDGKVITLTGSVGDTATITASADGALDITTTDAAGAAGNIQITADGTAELAGTTVTLDSSGGITLDADGGTITFADAGISLGTVTSSGFTGNVVGNVTGNISGTAGSATGNAATATALATPRAIGGVNFDGSAAIDLPGVNTAGNQNTSGTAAIATEVTATANNTTAETVYLAFVDGATGAQGIETDTGLTWNPNTNVLTAANVAGALTGNVTGNASGTAATVTTAAQPNITSLGTLTTLTVDNVIINGTTIGHTGDTDLITVADSLLTIAGDVTITGTAPTLTIGDAGAEDAKIVFDGNAQDFHIGLDDTADDLVIGLGSALGTTPAISIDENVLVTIADDVSVVGRAFSPTLTANLGSGIDLALGNNFLITTTGDVVLTFTNQIAGQSGTMKFVNDSDRAVTAHTNVAISEADLATISATGTYMVSYFVTAADAANTILVSASAILT
jgi:hypothetical protein